MPSPGADRWFARAVVLAQFGPAFLFSGVAVALPDAGRELALTAAELGLVETIFVGASTAALLPAGRVCDVADRAKIFRWTLLVFGALSLAAGCASSGWLLLTLRALQGVAAALCTTAGPALLVELVPPERRGRVFGAMIGMAYVGLAAGPLAAGFVVGQLGWRGVFFVGAAWILLSGLPAFFGPVRAGHTRGGRLHLPSAALLAGCIAGAIAAISVGERGGSPLPWASLAALCAAAFVWWQPRLAAPLLDLRELRHNAPLSSALCVQLLLYLNAYCSIFLLSLFLQVGKGLDPRAAGLWLTVGSAVMALAAPFAGRLADRVRPQRVAAAGVVAVLASSAFGAAIGAGTEPWSVGAVLALQGLGFGLFSSPNLAVILGSLPRERSGFASALAAQSRGLGMFAGMAVTSALLASSFAGRVVGDDPQQVVAIVHRAYLVLLATSGLALVGALQRRSRGS